MIGLRWWHAALAFAMTGTAAHANADCAALMNQEIQDTTITEAQEVSPPFAITDTSRSKADEPFAVDRPFCRVKGMIKPSPTSQISFETWLPADWNGDYFQTGNGGAAGFIRYPELSHAVNRGFAATSTDDGTDPRSFAWAMDPQRMLDFVDRAVHVTAVAGQALTKAYYGKPASHRFFVGGSKGGQEAMNEVQRYPSDFDGVVALYPATRGGYQAASTMWWAQQMTRTPDAMLREPELKLLNKAAIKTCVGKDGGLASDGFLTDPTQCAFDPGVLLCTGDQAENCLTSEQVTTARNLYAGPENYPELRMLPGSEWPQVGNLNGWSILDGSLVKAFGLEMSIGLGVLGQQNWSYRDFDIDRDMPIIANAGSGQPGFTFDPDIRAFQENGGKLILIHGWNDPMVPAMHSPLYWDMVVADQAEASPHKDAVAQTGEFMRMFMVPGYGHGYGAGLEPADPLQAIVDWVKTGDAPERLDAVAYADSAEWAQESRPPSAYVPDVTRADGTAREVALRRPLCAWPATPTVTAKNVECTMPAQAASEATAK